MWREGETGSLERADGGGGWWRRDSGMEKKRKM